MKKSLLFALCSLFFITACSKTYYNGNVRYVQDGDDCVYMASERGHRMSRDIKYARDSEKVVYKHTRCRDLYTADSGRMPTRTRKIDAIQSAPVMPTCNSCAATVSAPKCGMTKKTCNKCTHHNVQRRYYVVAF